MQRLKRVFNIDIEICERCAGQVKIIACIEGPAVIERILAHLKNKAPSAGTALLPEGRAPPPQAQLFDWIKEDSHHLCCCSEEAVGLLLACRQELGWKQGKVGQGAKNQRRNGLELAGKGASDGGTVGIDFSDCAFYPTYTHQVALEQAEAWAFWGRQVIPMT
jgi:hypothetical protein